MDAPHIQERKLGPEGTVIVRSHPAGTIAQIETLHQLGRHRDADALLKTGKVEVRQKNLVVYSGGYGYDILVQFLISAYNGFFNINTGTTLTGTLDGSTAVITGLSSTAGLTPGMLVAGIGIPSYSTLISVDSGTSVTISQATTIAGTPSISFLTVQQFGIQYGEIGTGNTTPTASDTALTTPYARTVVSYAFDNGFNTASIQFFFSDASLTNQTYYEFGTFIGGNSTIGTGNMFNHALFATPYTKSSGVDSTIEVDFEFGT
jgi:hypothetical protein